MLIVLSGPLCCVVAHFDGLRVHFHLSSCLPLSFPLSLFSLQSVPCVDLWLLSFPLSLCSLQSLPCSHAHDNRRAGGSAASSITESGAACSHWKQGMVLDIADCSWYFRVIFYVPFVPQIRVRFEENFLGKSVLGYLWLSPGRSPSKFST